MPDKLLHGADFQLGANQYGLPEREEDYRRAMETFVVEAMALGVAGIVLHGDTADMARERKELIQFLQRTWREPAASGLKVYFLAGDHDYEKPTIPETLELPNIVDAEKEFLLCLKAGKPFKPYGEDGPAVAAFHYHQAAELREILSAVRAEERPENRSTVIWLHQSLKPGAGANYADFEAQEFWNLGWHTVVAGDIHVGGIWSNINGDLPKDPSAPNNADGVLVYCGSPEMTDINEPEDNPRGFILASPKDTLSKPDASIFKRVPFANRPYKTYNLDAKTDDLKGEVMCWALDTEAATGMKPIIRIVSPDMSWDRDSEIRGVCLKSLFKYLQPDTKPVMVPNASELATSPDEQVYPGAAGGSTVFQRLAVVLDKANVSPYARELGKRILASPTDPTTWAKSQTAIQPKPAEPTVAKPSTKPQKAPAATADQTELFSVG